MLFFCPILRRVGFFSELLISLFSNSEVCLRPSCSGGQGLYHFSNGKKDKQWALLGRRGPCWCWLSSDAALLREGLCCVVSPPPCPALPRHVQLFPPPCPAFPSPTYSYSLPLLCAVCFWERDGVKAAVLPESCRCRSHVHPVEDRLNR